MFSFFKISKRYSYKEFWLTPRNYWNDFKEYHIGKNVKTKFIEKHKELVRKFNACLKPAAGK